MNGREKVVLLGLLLHCTLLFSIFDIFYNSPIIDGLPPHVPPSSLTPPSQRLFFISADGLRYDTLMKNEQLAPFLHSLIRSSECSSGMSISHVPTESRPAHVSMLAGFTEDVSSITKGWSRNAVPFDSLFNRCTESWQFGTEEIMHLFSHSPHTNTHSFSSSLEDFSSFTNWKLDEWVFQRTNEVLLSLGEESRAGRARFFFLHLVGIDTNGHGHKPHSETYRDNLRRVDGMVQQLTLTVQQIFPDGRSAFVFTSDHGMTDWGSHGGGSEEEIATPFLVWGSGLMKGRHNVTINQVDLAPLLSAILLTPPPTNNHGILPHSLINASDRVLFEAIYSNLNQLCSIVERQLLFVGRRPWLFLTRSDAITSEWMGTVRAQVSLLVQQRRYSAATNLISSLLPSVRKSIFIYHRIDRPILAFSLTLSFCEWILLLYSTTHSQAYDLSFVPSLRTLAVLLLVFLLASLCLIPLSHKLYLLLPLYLSSLLSPSLPASLPLFLSLPALSLLFSLIFTYRSLCSAVFPLLLLMPFLLPLSSSPVQLRASWVVLCVLCMPFPLLPPAGSLSLPLLPLLPPLLFSLLLLALRPFAATFIALHKFFQCASALCSVVMLLSYAYPCMLFRLLSWSVLLLPYASVARSAPRSFPRVFSLSSSLFLSYCMLCSSYESCFLLLLLLLLFLLLLMHSPHPSLHSTLSSPLSPSPLSSLWSHSPLFFSLPLLLVLASLFSTGNLASLSSFDPACLSRLLSVFSPFTMSALLIGKLLVPVLLVSLCVACCIREESVLHSLMLRLVMLTDVLSLFFFWQLKDEGSWLHIGMSIAHFVISMVTSLALGALFYLSNFLLTISFTKKKSDSHSFA